MTKKSIQASAAAAAVSSNWLRGADGRACFTVCAAVELIAMIRANVRGTRRFGGISHDELKESTFFQHSYASHHITWRKQTHASKGFAVSEKRHRNTTLYITTENVAFLLRQVCVTLHFSSASASRVGHYGAIQMLYYYYYYLLTT